MDEKTESIEIVPAPAAKPAPLERGAKKKAVLELWAQGHTNAEIAAMVGIDRYSVPRYLRKIKPEERIRIADNALRNLAMRAVGCIEHAIADGDVDSAFRLLEGIGILGNQRQAGLSRLGGDTNLNIAIQSLLPSAAPVVQPKLEAVTVEATPSADQPKQGPGSEG